MSVMEARRIGEALSESECVDLLRRTPPTMLYGYIKKYTEEPDEQGTLFRQYMHRYKKKWNAAARREDKLYWNEIFERAGVSNTYGYKLVSGHKSTLKRDTILRLCFACHMGYYDVLEALRCACLPPLRAKNARDAVIISAFCRGMSDPTEVSRMLTANGQKALETCCTGTGENALRKIG